MKLKDKNGVEFSEGANLKRPDGRPARVIRGDFENGVYGEGPDLIADAGFSKQLLSPERAKEFEVIDESSSN